MCVYNAHKCAQIVNITHRQFEQVLCNLGRVEKTERLIIYFNKLNWFTEMYLPTLSNNTKLSYEDLSCNQYICCTNMLYE
jgi:hypothetical protein